METILATIVGSKLHGTDDPESDTDVRGVFIVPVQEIISPFRKEKETHWVEGKENDNVSWELRKFCHMATQGNPSVLEVLVGIPYQQTDLGIELVSLLPNFLSKKCFHAFMGYSRNQEKKFRMDYQKRKYKYACAHVRTLYQLNHLLKTGDLIGSFSVGVREELRRIKNGMVLDADIFSRIFQLESMCQESLIRTNLQDSPDIKPIEDFIFRAYNI